MTRYVIAAGWDKRVTFWEDSRARHAAACRQVPHHGPAHDSDVLACALMDDSPNLVTASAGGELKVWNIESGVCRKVLCWPGMQAAPRHTRGVEELAFVAGVGRLKHVCVAVGGDQIARFWDAAACRLLHEHFLGAKDTFPLWHHHLPRLLLLVRVALSRQRTLWRASTGATTPPLLSLGDPHQRPRRALGGRVRALRGSQRHEPLHGHG